MTSKEYDQLILNMSFEDYIKDIEVYKEEFLKHFNGKSPREHAENQFKEFLPLGVESPNHSFWIVMKEDNNEEIGYLWISFMQEKKVCFISDIYLYEKWRGQGFGTEMLQFVEKHVKKSYPDFEGLYLNVFKHNPRAKQLYERYGFKVTQETFGGYNMLKSFNRGNNL